MDGEGVKAIGRTHNEDESRMKVKRKGGTWGKEPGRRKEENKGRHREKWMEEHTSLLFLLEDRE